MSGLNFEQDKAEALDGEKQLAESSTRLFEESCNCAGSKQQKVEEHDGGKMILANAELASWTRQSINSGLVQGLLAPTWTKEKMNQGLLDRLKK